MLPRFPGDAPRDQSRPLEEIKILVDARRAGERLDKALTTYLHWRSRTSVQRLIEEGRVALRGQPARRSCRVQAGDVVCIALPPRPDPVPAGAAADLAILYEDRWMVAVDKPAGMAVHPAGRTMAGTLIHFLHRRYRRPGEPERDVVPRLLHRIDRETSGVVAVGLDEELQGLVGRQFEERAVRKTYLAVVHGRPDPPEGTIDLGIGADRRSAVRLKLEARWDGSGLPALTRYRWLRSAGDFSLVELVPRTGRTHQLRVHMAAIGHPLVGDKIYGHDERAFLAHLHGRLRDDDRARLVLDRHALHSHRLAFHHPFRGREIEIEAPLPADLARLVES